MPDPVLNKRSRPRRYDLSSVPDFADDAVALAVAALDELLARAIDQVSDLPPEALAFVPPGSTLSIGALVVHMAWAEANWVARITGVAVPGELDAQLTPVGRAVPAGEPPALRPTTAEALIALCRRVRDEVTCPALASLADADAPVAPEPERSMTPRGVLMHLIWHWTYHSGQIGLLRELWGSGYTWTFGPLG